MALLQTHQVAIRGISVCVPAQIADNLQADVLPEKERELFVKTTGIRYRRLAPAHITAADLCFESAQRLLNESNTSATEIGFLIFITQTPDYIIPNTASLLQHRLGLRKNCVAFDVNLGCSGYVYGLHLLSSLMQNSPGSKGLLLVGDVSSHIISASDKSVAPLFSDAGSATLLQHSGSGEMSFQLSTDGSGFQHIMVPHGGFRHRTTSDSLTAQPIVGGGSRSAVDMQMDGLQIFNFALREIPAAVNALLQETKGAPDYYLFHQANLLMLESVRRKLQLPAEKVPYSLHDFGNTSSASIPLTLLTQLRNELQTQDLQLLLCGFGVGLSWGSALVRTSSLCIPGLIEL